MTSELSRENLVKVSQEKEKVVMVGPGVGRGRERKNEDKTYQIPTL